MVTRVFGVANGQPILFTPAKDRTWNATVPWTEDGEYVIEVYAEDGAGNTGYLCSMLFAISGHELQGYIVPNGYTVENKSNRYTGLPTINEFLGNIENISFSGESQEKKYQSEVQEGGYIIERAICSRDEH